MDFKSVILSDSNKLSLFLRLKSAYLDLLGPGLSQEYDSVFAYKLLSEKKNLKQIASLLLRQTYLYPRLHSSVPLLLNEVTQEPKVGDRVRLVQQVMRQLGDEHLFSEEVYNGLKSVTKFKFLHIGLKVWLQVSEHLKVWDPKQKHRQQLLDSMITPGFLKVLVKNLANAKAHLHDTALEVKSAMIKLVAESTTVDKEYALKMLNEVFGPNTLTRMSVRKN